MQVCTCISYSIHLYTYVYKILYVCVISAKKSLSTDWVPIISIQTISVVQNSKYVQYMHVHVHRHPCMCDADNFCNIFDQPAHVRINMHPCNMYMYK